MNCIACNKETNNPKFCSRSCSAKINNVKSPKRKPESTCKNCFTRIKKSRSYCKPCFKEYMKKEDYKLGEVIYDKHHKSSAFALVRSRARSILPKGPCSECGYKKHTEVHHIRKISSFSLETRLSVINHENNLVRLCPNCHWELEHLT